MRSVTGSRNRVGLPLALPGSSTSVVDRPNRVPDSPSVEVCPEMLVFHSWLATNAIRLPSTNVDAQRHGIPSLNVGGPAEVSHAAESRSSVRAILMPPHA